MTVSIFSAIVAAIATIISGYLAYRGIRRTDSTDQLSKAANLFGGYAEKMEKRVISLEGRHEDLDARLELAERNAEKYKKEANEYRKLITEVIQWISEILEWESRGHTDPSPDYTLAMILSHLTRSVKDRVLDLEDGA